MVFDSTVSCSPWSLAPWLHAHCVVGLHSVMSNLDSDSTVSCPMLSQTSWCPCQCRIRLHCFMPNAKSDFMVSLPMQIQIPLFHHSAYSDSTVPAKYKEIQTPWFHAQCRFRLHCVITNADSDSTMSCPMQIQTPWCHYQWRFRHHDVLLNAD